MMGARDKPFCAHVRNKRLFSYELYHVRSILLCRMRNSAEFHFYEALVMQEDLPKYE